MTLVNYFNIEDDSDGIISSTSYYIQPFIAKFEHFIGDTTEDTWLMGLGSILSGKYFETHTSVTATSISAYVQILLVNTIVKGAIYNGSNLLAETNTETITAPFLGWVTMNFASPPVLTEGTDYYLSIFGNKDTLDGSSLILDSSTMTSNLYYAGGTWPDFTNPITWIPDESNLIPSLYCTYKSEDVVGDYDFSKVRLKLWKQAGVGDWNFTVSLYDESLNNLSTTTFNTATISDTSPGTFIDIPMPTFKMVYGETYQIQIESTSTNKLYWRYNSTNKLDGLQVTYYVKPGKAWSISYLDSVLMFEVWGNYIRVKPVWPNGKVFVIK